MRVMFGNWKYLFKNFWYVLPSAILPAVFLALSLDFSAISRLAADYFGGELAADFILFFRVFSLIRIDGVLGALYSLLAVAVIVFSAAFLITAVEKHMRIGKRTPGGTGRQSLSILPSVLAMSLLFLVLYEIWAIVLSAVLFAVCSVGSVTVVRVFFPVLLVVTGFCFVYIVAAFFLWLPCIQITGFRPYDALLYAYRLAATIRWRLISALSLAFAAAILLVTGLSFVPYYVFLPVMFIVYLFVFPAFCIHMETAYFYADKIEREDIVHRHRGLL